MGDSNTIASHYLEGHSRVKAPARGPIPRLASVMEWGVVDGGKGSSRVVFIKEAGAGSGRRKFPGVGRKPLSDLWSLQLPGDSWFQTLPSG